MVRILSFVAAALLTVSAASAETVGFSQIGAESDWRTAFSANMQSVAKTRGIDLHFDDAQGSVDRQFAAVRRFIAERVDAIVIAPVVVSGWTPVLKEAQAAKIPVFIADRSVDAEPSLFVARIGNDTNLEGRLAASWLAQASRGHCAIVELQGSIGSAPAIGRKNGLRGRHRAVSRHAGYSLGKRRFHPRRRPARDDGFYQVHQRTEGCLRGLGAQRRYDVGRD